MVCPCSSRSLSKFVVLVVVAAMAVSVSGAWADTNLVLNPSFEVYNAGYDYMAEDPYVANWHVGYLAELVVCNKWSPHSGLQSLAMNASDVGWISQNLATVAGGTYNLSFYMSGSFLDNRANDPTRAVEVFWGGASLGPVVFAKPSDWALDNMGWTLESGGALSNLIASGSSTELKFVSLDLSGSWEGAAVLDDLSVTGGAPVPEPGTLGLLLLGLPGLVWFRRRKRT